MLSPFTRWCAVLPSWLENVMSQHLFCLAHGHSDVFQSGKNFCLNSQRIQLISADIYCHQDRSTDFIVLIHPIQWTIADPVGADRSAKRQKKPS